MPDTDTGFEVLVSVPERYLRLRAWGLWSVATALAYQREMYAGFQKLEGGGPWSILSDRRGSVPQSSEVQSVIMDVMRHATASGCVRTAFVLESATATLQMLRLGSAEKILNARVFHDEASAMSWIRDEKA